MVNNSFNINKTNSHLSPFLTKHEKITTYDDVNPGSDLGQAQTCGGVKQVNGILTLPS